MQTPKFLALPSSHSPAPPRHGLSLKRILASFCFRQPCGSGERHKSPVATAAAPCIAITALLIIAIIIIFIVQHLAALASPGGDLLPRSPPPKKKPLTYSPAEAEEPEEPPDVGTHKLNAEVTRGCGVPPTQEIPPPHLLPSSLANTGVGGSRTPPGPQKSGFPMRGGSARSQTQPKGRGKEKHQLLKEP